ncbi:rCG32349 [Rattus norvegicus]|uniref:RCG32349 n=1 Tax=Rattus norvegicus TaxID=10116 RepID=A6JXJ0_RAT|nr:rCG32349 [Rattus norvegicus]
MESPTGPRNGEAGERQGELSFFLSLVSSHLFPPQDSQDFGWEHSDGIGLAFSKS